MTGEESGADGDLAAAVEEFLDDAETVYGEYDQGYLDADAALRRLRTHLDDLEEAAEE
jgi:hypothetical protein